MKEEQRRREEKKRVKVSEIPRNAKRNGDLAIPRKPFRKKKKRKEEKKIKSNQFKL